MTVPSAVTTDVEAGPVISAVMPTRDRCATALRNVQRLLEDPLIAEVIVIADGCTDDTTVALRSLDAGERLKVVVHGAARGPEVSRNEGAVLARSPWLAFVDDDDQLPPGFFDCLLDVAARTHADLVSPRWVHCRGDDTARPRRRSRAQALLDLAADGKDPFPECGVRESIWINSNYLVRRRLAENARYNESLTGSYWRDETDVAVSVAKQGGRVVLTSDTASYMTHRQSGGIERRNRFRYETSVLVNEARFLRRHGRWLHEHRYIDGVVGRFAHTALQRLMAVVRDVLTRAGLI